MEDCVPICVPLTPGELVAGDGAQCEPIEPDFACKWACNGTSYDKANPYITETGSFYINTTQQVVQDIAQYVESLLHTYCSADRPAATPMGFCYHQMKIVSLRALRQCQRLNTNSLELKLIEL